MDWGDGEIACSGDNRYPQDFLPVMGSKKIYHPGPLSPRQQTIDLNFALKTAKGMLCFVILSP